MSWSRPSARRLGDAMALTARISADEKVEGGLGLEDAIELARRLEELGVDGLHVVTGSACDSPPWYYQHMALPAGVNEELAARIRTEVSIPVIVAGRLGDPERIRKVLDERHGRRGGPGRPLLADPDLPRKMREGREEEIMACGACLQGCLAQVKGGGPIGCIINPEIGREAEPVSAGPGDGERLVVVGGGPAGMQAALSADRAGYRVTLFESEDARGPVRAGRRHHRQGGDGASAAIAGPRGRASGMEVRTGVEATVDADHGRSSPSGSSSPPVPDRSYRRSPASTIPSPRSKCSPAAGGRAAGADPRGRPGGHRDGRAAGRPGQKWWWSSCSTTSPATWRRSPAR